MYASNLNNVCLLKGVSVDIFAEIYPCILPGLAEESIMDKRELCRKALCAIQSIVDAMHTETLKFESHDMIEDSRCKLMAIYNPLKHFASGFLPGY